MFQAAAKVVHKPWLAPSIARRADGFFVPLYQSLRISKAAFLLSVACRRQKENFSANFLGVKLAGFYFARATRESCIFHFDQAPRDKPLQLGESLALKAC